MLSLLVLKWDRGDFLRKEKAMFNLIENVALKDDNVRIVVLNGSRANPNAKKDFMQDYDVVYFVENFEQAKKKAWNEWFGETLLVHTTDDMTFLPSKAKAYMVQMLFDDYSRMDLAILPLDALASHLEEEPIYKVLIDKDSRVEKTECFDESHYTVTEPSDELVKSTIQTFLWLETYVAKGLYRHEHLYALKHLRLMRKALETVLKWQMGIKTNFEKVIGKEMKHMRYYLGEDIYKDYLKTYTPADLKKIWSTLLYMHDLFLKHAKEVCKKLDVDFDFDVADKINNYIKEIRGLSISSQAQTDVSEAF